MTTYDFIASNKRKTAVLIAVFVGLILGIGWTVDRIYDAGGFFIFIAAAYSLVAALASYYTGDKVALAMSGAVPVTKEENPYLVRMVENLCIATGMPMPKVHVIDDPSINAFAAGRNPQHASLAVTAGAIAKLENEELEGVIAHELSHIKNYDILVMTIVIVMVGIITIMGDIVFRMTWHGGRRRDRTGGDALVLLIGLALLVFAPLFAQLIRLAVSRRREYLADASGALMTRYPEGLADALRKIGAESRPMTTASAATAHLFIANPFSGRAVASLFSTHPPIEERIKALARMGSM